MKEKMKFQARIRLAFFFKIGLALVVIIFFFKFYSASRDRAEFKRNYDSFEMNSDLYTLPSGKVINLISVPSNQKYEVKTYLSYKDNLESWEDKYNENADEYSENYDLDAANKVNTYRTIIEEFETEHPNVRSLSYSVTTVSE